MKVPHACRLLLLVLAPTMLACRSATRGAEAVQGDAAATAMTTALTAHRAWWTAFTIGDTAHLQASTEPRVLLTLSTGRTYDRAAMLAQAATHGNGAAVRIDWADENATLLAPDVAVTSSRATETDGSYRGVYRFMTVLRRAGSGWRVAAAQSTRELAPAPRVAATVAGPVADYVGEYRTPRGFTLRIEARDSALVLVEPSGREVRMEPIAPSLFEMAVISMGNGIVRLQFVRDAAGRVTAMSRIRSDGIDVFPRIR